MQADTKKPNTLLRQQRLLRGWSQQRVVDELLTLFRKEGQSDPGINAETISKWERGERKPKAFYQEKLCLLFGKSAQDLGFLDMAGNDPAEPENQGIQSAFPSPAVISSPIDMEPPQLFTPHQRVDMPGEMAETMPEHKLGAWLAVSAGDLIPLFDAGWSREAILESLHVILRGVQAMPCVTRRTLLQLGAAAIVGGEEFDYGVWLQYQGTCSLYIGDAASADTYLEQALHSLKPNWIHQRASTALLQTQARLTLKEKEGIIASAHKASSLVTAVDSPLMYQGMLDLVQKSVVTFSHHTEMKELLEEVQQLIPGSLVQTSSRYLGGDV